MRLTVKQGDKLINELRFSRGPIYIGRQIGSQVFLSDRSVSRQHTVIYTTTDGKWTVEDLDSANKTYLNDDAVHKAEMHDGDVIKIADFTIEVHLDESDKQDSAVSLEDTLHSTLHEPQVVIRHLESTDAPLIKMQAKRGKDFSKAASAVCKSKDINQLVSELVSLLMRQFKAFHVWAALRQGPIDTLDTSKGKKINGEIIKLEDLQLKSRIEEVLNNHYYILVPRLPMQTEGERIQSAVIAPVMCGKDCFGVLYVDNSPDHEHYGPADMDYLILISLMTGAFIENL
ncbi:MAG: FHA domain-containing protein [Sedimentisphaerales bacterium]|nr:FHA domain-containing protein [Sedimentisphaerales bacterium]